MEGWWRIHWEQALTTSVTYWRQLAGTIFKWIRDSLGYGISSPTFQMSGCRKCWWSQGCPYCYHTCSKSTKFDPISHAPKDSIIQHICNKSHFLSKKQTTGCCYLKSLLKVIPHGISGQSMYYVCAMHLYQRIRYSSAPVIYNTWLSNCLVCIHNLIHNGCLL